MPAYLVVLLLMCPAVMLMIGFSVFIPRNRQRHQIQGIFARLKEVYREAESGSASEEDLKQFAQLAERCIGIINRRPDSEWARGFGDVLSMRGRIQQMSLSLVLKGHAKPVLVGSEIEKLAELRKQGMLSDDEFGAFSERFRISTGEKASRIITAIGDLHQQYRNGAMTKGNYHASLWSLMDRLDRRV